VTHEQNQNVRNSDASQDSRETAPCCSSIRARARLKTSTALLLAQQRNYSNRIRELQQINLRT